MSSPAWGLYRGALLQGPDTPRHLVAPLRHKRWLYVGVCAKDFVLGAAVADLGYGANAFAYVGALDGAPTRQWKTVAAPWQVKVDRRAARWASGAQELSIVLPEETTPGHLRARLRGGDGPVEIDVALRTSAPDTAVTCVAPALAGTADRWNLTTKDNTLRAKGTARWGGRSYDLDDAAVIDVTDAYAARRTVWNWASLAGLDDQGRAVGVNLCALHNDSELARENVAWLDGVPHGLGPVRFTFDRGARERSTWTITGDGVDLRFTPAGARGGDENLVLVVSKFTQPYGRFAGTVRAGAETVKIDGVAGVVEDHEALW
jgi:hypothetical protein